MPREQKFDHEEARRLKQSGYTLGGIVRHFARDGILVSRQAVWMVVREDGRDATVQVVDSGVTVTVPDANPLQVSRDIAQSLRAKGYRVSVVDGRTR